MDKSNEQNTNVKLYTTSSFGRQIDSPSDVISSGIQLPVNYEINNIDNANQIKKLSISKINKKLPSMNMYYDHHQVQSEFISQPTYHTHQSPVINKRLSIANKDNIEINNKTNIQSAASNTTEALGSLNNTVTSPKLMNYNYKYDIITSKQNSTNDLKISKTLSFEAHPKTSISSVPFSGDRVVMNNVAGSRKP